MNILFRYKIKMPESWNLMNSWLIVAYYLVDGFYLVNGFSTNAKVLVRKFLDGYHKELLWDIRNDVD